MARSRGGNAKAEDAAERDFVRATELIEQHPMFAPLAARVLFWRQDQPGTHIVWPTDSYGVVTKGGYVIGNPHRRAEVDEWVYVIAHCLLHLGFGHLQDRPKATEWNIACDCFVAQFLKDLRLGRPPQGIEAQPEFAGRSEEQLYAALCEDGVPPNLQRSGVAGMGARDMLIDHDSYWGRDVDWKGLFGVGLSAAVASAISVAAGYETAMGAANQAMTPARRAQNWIINNYPLLGAMAANFQLVEEPRICQQMGISIAAVDCYSKEIFVNPGAGLGEQEARFVIAHELLHVGLRHDARQQGRDPLLWNLACDFVINGWLVEMAVGELPKMGLLHDPQLKGESAESIYDRIATDLRRCRKLATLAGRGVCDILERGKADWWRRGDGMDLDELYRRCMAQGLEYHREQCRGYLPVGLVEEIRSLAQPPIPWDVELAEWFDDHFAPLEKVRSYARPSRRQSSTPDIPRPRYVPSTGAEDGRTFGVVLDTSGSMERGTLGKALGAIASYSVSRDVPMVRVVFCDAAAYDQGYMPPEDLAGRVRIRGRGGTVLQPGIDLLERAEDFPKDGPILVITDGYCDRLRIRREHGILLPEGHTLPFAPRGKVFRIR